MLRAAEEDWGAQDMDTTEGEDDRDEESVQHVRGAFAAGQEPHQQESRAAMQLWAQQRLQRDAASLCRPNIQHDLACGNPHGYGVAQRTLKHPSPAGHTGSMAQGRRSFSCTRASSPPASTDTAAGPGGPKSAAAVGISAE